MQNEQPTSQPPTAPAAVGPAVQPPGDSAPDELCEVVVTGPDVDWLTGFTRRLVEDRLAACGQLIAEIRSIYRWQGAIEEGREARVALHTRRALVPAIIDRADREHPYEIPCVLAVPMFAHPGYARWVRAETDAIGAGIDREGDAGGSSRAVQDFPPSWSEARGPY